jgi:hypothetical protein
MSETIQYGDTWCHIEQDEEANTIVMWMDVEPHFATRTTVGAKVRALTETGRELNLYVAKIDAAAGRIYVVPGPVSALYYQ